MTIAWTPTKGHTYKIWMKHNGVRTLIGKTTSSEFTIPSPKKGAEYFITVVNDVGESTRSNIVYRP